MLQVKKLCCGNIHGPVSVLCVAVMMPVDVCESVQQGSKGWCCTCKSLCAVGPPPPGGVLWLLSVAGPCVALSYMGGPLCCSWWGGSSHLYKREGVWGEEEGN